MDKKTRNLSLELLRICSMCMIIILHFFTYTNVMLDNIVLSKIGITGTIIHSLCNVAVNCYILISGYFCMDSSFKLSKIYKLVIEVFLYSILIYLMMIVWGNISFSIKELFNNLLPTLTRRYWFVTSYLGTYILSPYIKKIICIIKQKEYFTIILSGFVLFVLYYNLFFFCDNLNFGGATGIVWFIYLYLVGGYIRKYKKESNLKKNIKKYIIVASIALFSRVPFYILYFVFKKEIFLNGAPVFDSVYNSIFTFLSSVCFFLVFLDIKINNKWKNIILFFSKSSFAVYLLHENYYIRNLLWKTFDYNMIINNSIIKLLLLLVFLIVIVYILATIIDFILKQILALTLCNNKLINKLNILQEKIEVKYEDFLNRNVINYENK